MTISGFVSSGKAVQPTPEKMRLEMVVEMEIEVLDGHHRSLFKELI